MALLKVDFPDIRCCIVGDGPEKPALVELAKNMEVCGNVEFAGFQEYRALIGKIKASKVLVLPSSREGFGMVVIEAFACGVPVVTVRERYNAAQGLVDDGVDGFVVELGDREIAKGIERILVKNTNYKQISEAVFRKANKYDWIEVLMKLENSYEEFALSLIHI